MLEDRLTALEAKLDALAPRFEGRTRGEPGQGAVAALEQAQGVRLPEEYRAFLLRVGDGAPGLLPLARWGEALLDEAPLRAPCLLDPAKGHGDYGDDDEPAQGTIALTPGSPHAVLVVSGERRGQVLYVDLDDYWSEVVEDARGEPVGFATWYAAWLDASGPSAPGDAPGRGSAARRLAEGLLGSEDELVAALGDPRADARRRRKAVVGLDERGSLGPAGLAALDRACEDPDPTVRRAALRGLDRHRGPEALERLATRVGDPSPLVRRELVRLIAAAPEGRPLLRALVDDDDPAVVQSALGALLRGETTADALADLLARDSVRRVPDARGLLLHALGDTADPRWLPALLGFLEHEHAPTRLIAAVALRALGSTDACARLEQRRRIEPAEHVRTAIERTLGALGCPEPA
ncbi:MAG: HEAT repeat domain-containing protein [Myxococcales bacterium]|nr:HEAT repeat domain-containing protein [Myxococcales bacterium]